MNGAQVITNELVEERIHGEHTATLRRQTLKLPQTDEHPPLAIKRTTLPDGPTGPPLILVHGFAQNRYSWRISRRSVSGWYAERGYDVLVPDLRGHGLSRRWGAGNAWAFEEYVDDIERVAQLCETPPFGVGHSLGAAVLTGVSTRTPLRGLVHVAGVGVTFAGRNRTLRALSKLSLAAEPVLQKMRFTTRWAGLLTGTYFGAISDLGGYGAPISGWAPRSMERDLLAERLEKGFDWTSIEVWLEMARWAGGRTPSYAEAFRTTDVPLLVLIGDQDPLVTREDGDALLAASGSQDRNLVELDAYDTGRHWGHLDLVLGTHAPDVVWPLILDWMEARG